MSTFVRITPQANFIVCWSDDLETPVSSKEPSLDIIESNDSFFKNGVSHSAAFGKCANLDKDHYLSYNFIFGLNYSL